MKKVLLMAAVLLVVASSMCVQQKEEEHQLTCDAEWSCTEWSDCLNSEQTRECTDAKDCNNTEGKPSETESCEVPTDVASIQLNLLTGKDFNSDGDVDGIYFKISPKTTGGSQIVQEGTVNVAMWLRSQDENYNVVKGDLIGMWNDTLIHEDDYLYTGVPITLSYTSYVPKLSDYAIIEVTLITPQGAKITAVKDNILIGRQIFY